MRASLAAELDSLEQRRNALTRHLAEYPDAQLRLRPKPDSWSLLEVMEHLMLSEEASLDWVTRTRRGRVLQRRWYHGALALLIARALDSAMRVPWTGRRITPTGTSDLATLQRQWAEVAAGWQAYARSITGAAENALVFRHPIGVPMNAQETLVFLRRHFDHHMHQVRRIERSMGLPGRAQAE